MRVLMITRGVYPIATGGVEIHVDSVARILKDKVDFTLLHEGRFIETPPYHTISVTKEFIFPGILPQIRAFFSSIRIILSQRKKPDVIHVQTATLPLLTGYIASSLLRVPLIVSCHGSGIRKVRKSILHRIFKSFLLKKAIYVTCVSKELRGIIHYQMGICFSQIHIIPNGFDSSLLEVPPKDGPIKIFATISNFRREKDPMTLLAAIREVKMVFPNIQLIWVGEGPLLQDSKKYVTEYDLGENVKFLGKQSHTNSLRILSSSDAFILSSLVEGLPTALIEAMALAKPVIATDVGGVSDIIKDGITGLLVTPSNPNALAQVILSILQNENMVRKLALKAREEVRHLDWHSIAGKYYKLLDTFRPYVIQEMAY